MTYDVEVRVDKVVCRNPESVTTGDRFTMVCTATTDRDQASGNVTGDIYVSPLRILRKHESATFFDTIYKGRSSEPRIALTLRAWDKDLNSAWIDNREEISEIKDKFAEGLSRIVSEGDVAKGDVVTFVVNWVYTLVDTWIRMDLDDQLADYAQWILFPEDQLSYGVQTLIPFEVKFARPPDDLNTGYSDWDYSVFFTIAVTPLPPSFGGSTEHAWHPVHNSRVADLIGRYTGGGVTCLIDRSPLNIGLMDVTITQETLGSRMTTISTNVPISRVFVVGGVRELEDQGSVVPPVAGASVSSRPLITGLIVENAFEGRLWSERAIGGSLIGTDRVMLKEQIGPDLLQLRNKTALEVFDLGLRYLWPVPNILYRENSGASVVALFKQQV